MLEQQESTYRINVKANVYHSYQSIERKIRFRECNFFHNPIKEAASIRNNNPSYQIAIAIIPSPATASLLGR